MSNKVYLADKATLDSVKTTVEAVNSGVGSVSAKVNAVDTNVAEVSTKMNTIDTKIGTMAGKVEVVEAAVGSISTDASLAVVNSENAAKYAFLAADQTAQNNVGNSQGNIHGKLSYLIDLFTQYIGGYPVGPVDVDCPPQKILVRGDNPEIPCTPNSGNWHIGAVRIAVPGVVHSVYNNSPTQWSKNTRVTIDNNVYELGRPNMGDMYYIVQTKDGQIIYTNAAGLATTIPIRFKNQFIVDVETNGVGNTMPTLRVCYETYHDYPGV